MASSLTRLDLIALEYSSHSPELVYGTGSIENITKFFLEPWLFSLPETSLLALTPKSCGTDLTYTTSCALTPESNNRLR